MLTRLLLAAAVLAPMLMPTVAPAKTPHHRHHAARVSTATFRVPAAKPPRELRASRGMGEHVVRTRYAAGRHHPLMRGS